MVLSNSQHPHRDEVVCPQQKLVRRRIKKHLLLQKCHCRWSKLRQHHTDFLSNTAGRNKHLRP